MSHVAIASFGVAEVALVEQFHPFVAAEVAPPLADLVQLLLVKEVDGRPTMRQIAATLERMADQQPIAKRSVSSQALPPVAIAFPDATLLVSPKKPEPVPAVPPPSAAVIPGATMPVVPRKPEAVAPAPQTGAIPDETMLVGRRKPKSAKP